MIKDAEKIIKFITNHHIIKAKYEEKRKSFKVPHTLSMAVITRWFRQDGSLRSLSESKYVLIQLADENRNIIETINPKTVSSAVLNLIKTNEFWDGLSVLVKTIEMPAKAIGK